MSDLGDKWKDWVVRFWWLRGAAAAMAVVAILPQHMNLERYEFLRALHAIIVGWNTIANQIGKIIGEILFVPYIKAAEVNTCILFFSIIVPIMYAFFKPGRSIAYEFFGGTPEILKDLRKSEVNMTPVYIVFWGVRFCGLIICFGMTFVFWMYSTPEHSWYTNNTRESDVFGGFLFFIVPSISLIIFFYFAIKIIRGFGRGIVYAFSFIIVIEVLYFLPITGGYLNTWSCEVLEIPADEC